MQVASTHDEYTPEVLTPVQEQRRQRRERIIAEAQAAQSYREKIECETSLAEFIRHAWPVIEPATRYMHNWHIDVISEYLAAVRNGDIRRLVINIPPRYMKSTLVTICFPCWWWASEPTVRFMFASYSKDLSRQHSIARRCIIQSEWYSRYWAMRGLIQSQPWTWLGVSRDDELTNAKQGRMVATSIGGKATGLGGDCLIVDDPHKVQEAQSKAEREKAVAFVDQTLSTRLDDKKKGRIVLVMQRLHEEDCAGMMLKHGGWEHLKLEAEATRETKIFLPISKSYRVRQPGDILWPEREGEQEIATARVTLGSYGFAGQYQQSPSPEEGGIFRRKWFTDSQYAELPVPTDPKTGEPKFDYVGQSWDASFKDPKASIGHGKPPDYVVGQVWGVKGADAYLLYQVRKRMGFSETLAALRETRALYPKTRFTLMEDKANGPAVIDSLRHEIPGLIAVNPQGGKDVRAHACSPMVEAGNIHLPKLGWADDNIEEACAFPNASNDDTMDAMTQFLLRTKKQATVIEFAM